jgi:hypothetical protein
MKDANEVLAQYFQTPIQPQANDAMLRSILNAKGRRKQKLLGGASGFLCGLLLAASVLLWSMRPVTKPSNDDSAFLARMQLVNSGLASRSSEIHGAIAR